MQTSFPNENMVLRKDRNQRLYSRSSASFIALFPWPVEVTTTHTVKFYSSALHEQSNKIKQSKGIKSSVELFPEC